MCKRCKKNLCTSSISLFKDLPIDIQVKLAESADKTNFKANQTLVYENDEADFIIVLHQGMMKLHRYDNNGKEIIVEILEAGDIVGEENFLEGGPFPFMLTAITDVDVCIISRDDFYELISSDREASLNLIKLLSDSLKKSKEQNALLFENNATMRLIRFLLFRYEEDEDIELSIEDIGSSINLRPETVSRKLKQLQVNGLVERVGQKQIKILDYKKLKSLL